MFQHIGIIYVTLLLALVNSQSIVEEFSNPCTNAASCGKCIQISDVCTWCAAETFPIGKPRCDIHKNLLNNCPEEKIVNPVYEMDVTKDSAWTSGGQNDPPVQVKPQEMDIKLRPNEPVTFKLKFQQQENYPVDLYFLLDLSYGMVRQKEAQQRLIALGNDISEKLREITNNFRLGFGTFVDKVLMPYTAWTEQMLKDRCPLEGGDCRAPYDFKNEVNLEDDAKTFAKKMTEALKSVSQSIDDAEGGLDGLVQALECDSIGWRKVSRRIIVYSSNSLFHLAGSGKLGGATKQSKLKCALNSENLYAEDKIYDYPSVSQIASKLREKNANVIFAVMSNVTSHYEVLKSFMDGAVVGELAEDSKNIVELISSKYYELRSRIEFKANNTEYVDIDFKSKCMGEVPKKTATCENLEIGDSVEFEVFLKVRKEICDGKTGLVEKKVGLNAVGLNEQLTVNLKVMCECDCQSSEEAEENSKHCESHGTLECGICKCNEGRYGRKCNCDGTDLTSEESLRQCRASENDTQTCSGNGECVCGECICFALPANKQQNYTGAFCECNDFSCPYGEHGMCGGSSRGLCVCGTCNCLSGWSGIDCECSTDTTACMASNGLMCNNSGECVCGKCQCYEHLGMSGPSCEDCLTCPTQCNEHIDCAQCTGFGTGKYNKEACKNECPEVLQKDTLETGIGIRSCSGLDVDGCTFFFTYEYTAENDVLIKVQKTKDCPEEAPVAAIVGGTVAAVVLIPLLIICLIIFIRNRRDAKEYADFMKEKDKAKWDSGANPIYKDPKSTFQNPTYKGGKK